MQQLSTCGLKVQPERAAGQLLSLPMLLPQTLEVLSIPGVGPAPTPAVLLIYTPHGQTL